MRSRRLALVALLIVHGANGQEAPPSAYRLALPGYRYEFPRDHFNHPDFQTEWWYYTGNLRTPEGRAFGFELTFFRQAMVPEQRPDATAWDVRDVYLAHLALSDLDGRRFIHEERLNRSGPGLAGASQERSRIWNGNWSSEWTGERQRLQATTARLKLDLALEPAKPPIVHGGNGVSQKGAGPGKASHYISLTRLVTRGSIEVDGQSYTVTGLSWMDHEFFTHQLEPGQLGWDWFSLQFDDGSDLMLFQLRREGGAIDRFSAGTYIDSDGRSTSLGADDFRLEPLGQTWTSPDTRAVYPVRWRIVVHPTTAAAVRAPVPAIDGVLTTPLVSQEIVSRSRVSPSYWEGAVRVAAQKGGRASSASGYLEMTGYDRPVILGSPPPTPGAATRR